MFDRYGIEIKNWFNEERWDTILGRHQQGRGKVRHRACSGPHAANA